MPGAADGAGACLMNMRRGAPGRVSSDNPLATCRPQSGTRSRPGDGMMSSLKKSAARWRFAVLAMLLALAMLGASGSAFAQESAAAI